MELTGLQFPKNVNILLEQYPTPPSIAATLLWHAYMQGDICNRVIFDVGCGNGILGIGAAKLGAKEVWFLDIDREMVRAAQENATARGIKNAVFVVSDITEFHTEVLPDTIVMNPPFGSRSGGGDMPFIQKVIEWKKPTYIIHRLAPGVSDYLSRIFEKNKLRMEIFGHEKFEIPWLYNFHRKRKVWIEVFLAKISPTIP